MIVTKRLQALVIHSRPEALGELVELLQGPRLHVDTARSQTEAMNKIRTGQFHILIVGHRPPSLDGIAILEASVKFIPDAMRILMVGADGDGDHLDISPDPRNPIIRFVGRASERSRLVALVNDGLTMLSLVQQQRELVRELSVKHKKLQNRETLLDFVVRERTAELEESYLRLKAANRQALFGLAEAIEAKDPYTMGHCGRVAAYAMVLAEECGYPKDKMETLEFGAFLHDIGKIGIRDAVLLKPGPLDQDEWMHMREHPVKGFEIASKIAMLDTVMPAVRNHHERWDGNGYPDKLAGENIPLCARIVAIADAYDAMATDRPYKKALPLAECEKILIENANKMFDGKLVKIFCDNHLGEIYDARYGNEDYKSGY